MEDAIQSADSRRQRSLGILVVAEELERDVGGASLTVGRQIEPEERSIRVPVSQDRSKALRNALLENATGLRRP